MSNQGSDFRDSYLQEPSAKRAKLSNSSAIDPSSGVLRLHTEWVQRDPSDRVTTYVGSPAESPIPVPQSDFEIEINSSNQDGGVSSPGQEISIRTTTNSTEPRILTIDNRTVDMSLSSHPQDTAVTTTMVTSIPLQTEEIPLEHPSITTTADFSSIISNRGIMEQNQIQVEHQPLTTGGDLNTTPFILSSQSQTTQEGQSGPLYVMIPPNSGADILHAMSHTPVSGFSTTPYSDVPDDSRKQKDLVRKQTHNEVERRRRDRINELIKLLAEIVPGCQKKDASNGNIVGYVYSKGTVLEKTVEYVRELMLQNEQLSTAAKLAEKSASALQVLQNQITVLEKENAFLRAQMIQIGIDTTSGTIAGRNLLPNSLAQSLLNTAQLQAAPPPQATPTNNTTQLLVSLAQSLTNNPLLASLAQASSAPPTNIPAVTQVTPSTQTQVSSMPQTVATGNSNQANLLMNSLVQVLTSMAAPVPTQPPVPIPAAQPQGASNISANAAAMSLINSLLLAQNTVGAMPSHTPNSTSLPSSVPNILADHNTDKSTPT